MKRIPNLLLMLFVAAVLTISSASMAAGFCANVLTGKDSNGSVVCVWYLEDADWCYYNCECTGNCDNVYAELGLIDA